MPISQGTYLLYCILEKDTADDMLDDLLPSMPYTVTSIHYRDISAIANIVDAEIANNLGQHEETLKDWLASYQQINIDIFQHYTILPLRFGIMVDQEEEIEDFLANSYLHIKWALERLRNKAEFVIQLSWDLDSVLGEIAQGKHWLENAEKSVNLTNKVELGRLLFQVADRKRREIINSVDLKLSKVSLDSSDGRNVSESVILNRSYLIEKTEESRFDEVMAELGAENKSYLSFKYIGPIPPYSFAPLEFKRGNYDMIDHARRILSLPDRANLEHIKSSYRKLSLRYHPDKNLGDQNATEYFKQVDEAYKILETYCHSYRDPLSPEEDIEYSFTKGDVEEIFIAERAMMR